MKSISFFILFSISLFFSKSVIGQTELSHDEVAIHKILQGMTDAWAAKDGEQFASFFADDHDFIVWAGMYSPNNTRENNARGHQGIFNTIYKNWDVELRVDKMRFVRPDLALVHVLGAGGEKGKELPPYPNVLQSILMEKTETGWHILSFHNLDIEYETILRKPFPTDADKVAYAKEHYKGWYQ